jgi:YwiC-like protein
MYTIFMRNETKSYFLKEYGSWSVLCIAYLTGLIASRGFAWQALPVFFSLGLLINSKQAFTKMMRGKSDRQSLLIFLGHLAVATTILIAVFGRDITILLPLLVFPIIYLLLARFAGEHFILTEVLGFVLISLAAVIAKFTVVGGIDVRLFVAVAFYFTAGVFKVKTLLLKKTRDRVLTVLYILAAVFAYRGFHIVLLILLPLIDNLVAAALLYKVKLKTTGWIEVVKSVLFLILMSIYY